MTLIADTGEKDRHEMRFGLRDFSTRGTQFTLNGKPVLLRGRHDACVFPLTGYAPMDKAAWLAYFKICRDYGLNHVRFHTWCPPRAAFEAADETLDASPLAELEAIHQRLHADYEVRFKRS